MIIFIELSIETIGIIVAVYIIIHGLVLVILDIKASIYYVPFDGLFSGILSMLMGVLLLCKPKLLSIIFTIVIGLWMILSSINYIKIAIKLFKTKLPWLQILLLGILDLIAGFIVILNPFEATLSITLFAGIMLIVHSTINIIDVIIIKKDVYAISKALESNTEETTK